MEGVKFTACPIFICCKIIVPLWIETRTAYKWVINGKNPFVCCLFIFIYIFVSRSFPLPSAFPSTDIERGKVFGLNTLRRRKILPETACRLTFQLSRADVLPSQTSRGKGRMTESENSYISQIDDRPNQILSCNNEKCTVLLLVHKKVVPLFQDELYINANHASM